MRGYRAALVIAALGLAGYLSSSACGTSRNPLYCDESQECTEAATPFCDLEGEYQDKENRCIANPFGSCETSADCAAAEAPLCDPAVGCLPCTKLDDSDLSCSARSAATPICNADGRCIACQDDSECPNEQPICDPATLTCGSCTPGGTGNVQCTTRGGITDTCNDFGACVECIRDSYCSDPAKPLCGEDGLCRGCIEHEECDSGVCERETGVCVDPANIYYHDQGKIPFNSGADYIKLGEGTFEFDTEAPRVPMIGSGLLTRLQEPSGPVDLNERAENLVIDDEMIVTNASIEITLWRVRFNKGAVADALNSSLNIIQSEIVGGMVGANLYISQSVISIPEGNAVIPTNAVFEQTIFLNTGVAILAEAGDTITIDRCEFRGGTGESAVIIDGADYTIRNSFFVENQGNAVDIKQKAPTTGIFEFNTVANNGGTGVICAGSDTALSNNIVWGNATAQVAGGCPWSYSIIEGGTAGEAILTEDPGFFAPLLGDFRLGSSSPAIDAADPTSQNTVDFDGDLRPLGLERDIGADEFRP